MIYFLVVLVSIEAALVLMLMFRNPIRKLVIMGLDLSKQRRGTVIVKTVVATLVMVFISILLTLRTVHKRMTDAGSVNPTDQVLFVNHLLEASLMGFFLFLALMMDRFHHYIKQIHRLNLDLDALKKEIREYNAKKNMAKEVAS